MGSIYRNGVQYMGNANTRTVELTWSEYEHLTEQEKNNGTCYYISDVDPFVPEYAHYGFTPIGTVISVMGNTAPQFYLKCDGTVYNIADYPELANYFKEQFNGAINKFGGDGTTTFAVPDLRGEFLRGTGTNGHGEGVGADVGEHQHPTLHNVIIESSSQAYMPLYQDVSQPWNTDKTFNENTKVAKLTTTVSTNTWYGSTNYSSRPTNTAVLYCIAYKNLYVSTIDEGSIYTAGEKVIGQWIDGKPIYQKVYSALNISCVANAWTNIIPISDISYETLLYGCAFSSNNAVLCGDIAPIDSTTKTTGIRYLNPNTSSRTIVTLIIRYTKTTD